MSDKTYKYDVAFSFVSEDEGFAEQLNSLIAPRLTTFLYSKNQNEVAGTDGEKTFNRVFGSESRIVVVVYRNSWGNTPWTRIEQTAIKNRAYDKGYDFVLVIPVRDEHPDLEWLPKTTIWIGFQRWGLEAAAGVIEARVQQAGGDPHDESVMEKAKRLKQEKESADTRKGFLESTNGVNAAVIEANRLFELVQSTVEQIKSEVEFPMKATPSKDGRGIDVTAPGVSLSVDWRWNFENSLDGSELSIVFWKGRSRRLLNWLDNQPKAISHLKFDFDRNQTGTYIWRRNNPHGELTSERLADDLLKSLMEYSRSHGNA